MRPISAAIVASVTANRAGSPVSADFIVIGTGVTEFSGEIVLYLNPYVWTLNP